MFQLLLAPARGRLAGVALLACASAAAAPAGAPALDLPSAVRIALDRQPLLLGLEARARAARARAVSARALPDPQLSLGLREVPADGADAWSLRSDPDAQLALGLTQEFPRARKRELRGEQWTREAQAVDAQHALVARDVARDTGLAWIELWRYARQAELARADAVEAHRLAEALRIALERNTASQAEMLSARIAAGRADDAARAADQGLAHARGALGRWIGDASQRAVTSAAPRLAPLPPLEQVIERAAMHPQISLARAQARVARGGADLAHAAYRPDWRLALGYGHRPAFPEMLSIEVGVDLPAFTHNRQDRELAAALAEQDAAEAAVSDALRQLAAEAHASHHGAERLEDRLAHYRTQLVPEAEARSEAARVAWAAGTGSLREVLEARRAALELRMAHLDLQLDRLRHAVQLEWLGAFDQPAFIAAAENLQ